MQHEAEDDWIFTGQDEVPEAVRHVMIAESITRIPDEAFKEHPELEEVTLSSSVREIGKFAFYFCKKLKFIFHEDVGQEKKLGIPSTVQVIDDAAFARCESLESLCLNEGLERIGGGAFLECRLLTKVDIPSTVKVIDDSAFFGCNRLKSLCLNEGHERIGIAAFKGCEGLTMVDIPSTVKVIDDFAFLWCRNLKSLCLNEGHEQIGYSAFGGCEVLTMVDIPSTVKVIGAFFGCISLKHVQLPATLERIGAKAFNGCSFLNCVQFVSEGAMEASLSYPNLEEGAIIFPEKVELQIDEYAFRDCRVLRKVIVASKSTKLGIGVFYGCRRLVFVELAEGLQAIEQGLFEDCRNLSTVKIPSSVIKIGERAFCDCRSLTSFDFPHGLLEIAGSSFYKCVSLETLHIPSRVSAIGESAFSECRKLRQATLPATLEGLEDNTFEGCEHLEYIDIPSTVSFIGDKAFSDCVSLSHIRIPPSVESIAKDAFLECRSLISIELPAEESSFDIDLSGCTSLVNVEGSVSTIIPEDFFQDSMLGHVVEDETDLDHRLNHRFDNSPLNKLCYYQSYHSSEDAMVQLRSLMEDDSLVATNQMDMFGMTPLHVVSLSQTPNMDMLLTVMNAGNLDHIVHSRDSFGSTAMDYLCLNRMPSATEVIRRVLCTRFNYLFDLIRSWNSDTLQAIDEALAVDFPSRRREIVAIYLKLSMYERKEIFSLIELYLWKIEIEEVGSKKEQIDRKSCRIGCGASVVLPLLLPFLDKLHEGNYSVHHSS